MSQKDTDKLSIIATNKNFLIYNHVTSRQFIILLLISSSIFFSCKDSSKKSFKTIARHPVKLTPTIDSVLSNDYSFYSDSVFKAYNELLAFLFNKYDRDTCVPLTYQKKNLKEYFEGFKNAGDIKNDGKTDSIFILNPLNSCEYDDGQSYYFTDTTLPRLKSNSYCCHPSNFFKVKDIDEDGICEIGIFHSGCTSRYKSLRIFRLKDNDWEQIAQTAFDILTQDPEKVELESLVQKISKNRFRVKSFIDEKVYWDTVLIK